MCRTRVLFVITDNQNTWDFQLHTFSYCFKISYCSRALLDRKWTKDITVEKNENKHYDKSFKNLFNLIPFTIILLLHICLV